MSEPLDRFSHQQSRERKLSVYSGSKAGHEKRTAALFEDFDDPARLRELAGRIKTHTLDHLDWYL